MLKVMLDFRVRSGKMMQMMDLTVDFLHHNSILTYLDTWEVVAAMPGRRVEATSW